MKRKLFSLLLALFMVMTSVPISAFATGTDVGVDLDDLYTMQISVDNVTAELGKDTVTVNISVARNGGFAGVTYQLMYDNSVLTLESEPVIGELSGFDLVSGPVDASSHVAMLSSEADVIGDGTLVTYTFKINPEAQAGKYDLTLLTAGQTSIGTPLEVLDETGSAVTHVVVNGSVTIPGFTVAYDANGGTGAPASVIKTNGRDVTISALVPARSGYNFLGWATSASAEEAEYVAGDTYTIDADVTLYAVWEKIAEAPGTIVLAAGTAEAKVGEEVSVGIDIISNPGIGAMRFDVVYDNTALELLGYENPYSSTISAVDRYEDKVNVVYVNIDNAIGEDTRYTGNFITLKFKVKDTASDGLASIKIVPYEDEFYKHEGTNLEEVDVAVQVTDGGVNVTATLLGDIDMDGDVDIDDAVLLFQYSVLPDMYPIDYTGNVDFDKNGSVDIDDAVLLFQYSVLPDLYPIG